MRIGNYEFYVQRYAALGGKKRRLAFSWLPYCDTGLCGCILVGFLCFGVTRLSKECLDSMKGDAS